MQLPMKIEKYQSGIYFVSYFDSIKNTLEAQLVIQLCLEQLKVYTGCIFILLDPRGAYRIYTIYVI
jgi:hypothetical protein